MNFNSLNEFFYKLYNRCLAVMFIPIILFVMVYYFQMTGDVKPIIRDNLFVKISLIALPILTLFTLTIVHLVMASRIKMLRKEPSLGIRLEKYFSIGFIRIASLASASVLMAVGLALTTHAYFTLYFGGLFIWLFFIWPMPYRVSKDLLLRGDEKKLVITKGAAFR